MLLGHHRCGLSFYLVCPSDKIGVPVHNLQTFGFKGKFNHFLTEVLMSYKFANVENRAYFYILMTHSLNLP